jgi:arabinogalactan oligomer/maltooligosaccharide transport system substrate-binding protein
MRLRLVAILAALLLVAVGCGWDLPDAGTTLPTSTTAPETTTTTTAPVDTTLPGPPEPLTVWVLPGFADAMAPAAAAFTAALDIPVEIEEHEAAEAVAAAGAIPPDLFMAPHVAIGDLVAAGRIVPIELGNKAQGFYPVALAAVTLAGDLYGVPVSMDSTALLTNPAVIESPPAGFAEIEQVCRSIDTDCAVFDADPDRLYGFLSAPGGYYLGSSGAGPDSTDIGIDGDAAITGGEFLSRLVADGIVALRSDSRPDLLVAAGEAALTFGSAAEFRRWNTLTASALPIMEGQRPAPLVAVDAMMVNAASSRTTEATLLLTDYLVAPGSLQEIHDATRLVPVRDDTTPVTGIAPFLEGALDGTPAPHVPDATAVIDAAAAAFAAIGDGDDAAAALREAGTAIRAALAGEG